MVADAVLTLDPSEIVGIVAFAEIHAPEHFKDALHACGKALEVAGEEERRRETRNVLVRTFMNRGFVDLSVRAQKYLLSLPFEAPLTLGDLETVFMASDDRLRRESPKLATKKVLRQIRSLLKAQGLNY